MILKSTVSSLVIHIRGHPLYCWSLFQDVCSSYYLPRVILAEEEQLPIVDVDGSYIHRKYVSLREAGEQVLLPQDPPPPPKGWKQVTEETHKDLAGCIP